MNLRSIVFTVLAVAFAALVIFLVYIGIHNLMIDPDLKVVLNTPLYKVPFGYALLGLFLVLYVVSHFFRTEVTCCECGEDVEDEEEAA